MGIEMPARLANHMQIRFLVVPESRIKGFFSYLRPGLMVMLFCDPLQCLYNAPLGAEVQVPLNH